MTVAQNVQIVVTIDPSKAAAEIDRMQRQAQGRPAAAPGTGPARVADGKPPGGGSSIPGSAIRFNGRARRAKVTARTGRSIGARSMRSGLGRLASKGMGRLVGGTVAGRVLGAARLAGGITGISAGSGLAAASAAVIGVAVWKYIESRFPSVAEVARTPVDRIRGVFASAAASADAFSRGIEDAAVLGIKPKGGTLAFAENLTRMSEAQVALQQAAAVQVREALRESMQGDLGESIRRMLLGTTGGQLVSKLPQLRSYLLEQVGMR